jgi:signal transduction histidine kinase
MSWARNARTVDTVVAALFLVACAIDILGNDARDGPLWGNLLAAAGIAGLLLIRRRAPVAAALTYFGILLVLAAWLTPPGELVVPLFGLLFFCYAAAIHASPAGGAIVLAGVPLTIVAVDLIGREEGAGPLAIVLGVAAFLVGRAVHSRLRLAAQLHEEALLAQEEEEAEAARAVLRERRRIAREMHDVVAHSISVMVVQAGGARRILEHDPARAVEAGAEIERVGRDALLEMRRLLGALNPREGGPQMAPQPGMADVAALLERARTAGLPVEMHEQGERRPLAPGLDLAVYRILQEALTNSLKHSGPAPTDVHLHWLPDRVELEVLDAGAPGNGFVDGQGLMGMRERVRLYGGDLVCARRPEGGFQVRARIPFMQEESV